MISCTHSEIDLNIAIMYLNDLISNGDFEKIIISHGKNHDMVKRTSFKGEKRAYIFFGPWIKQYEYSPPKSDDFFSYSKMIQGASKTFDFKVNVSKHRSNNVLGWVSNSSEINLNSSRLLRNKEDRLDNIASLAGSIAHEIIHCIDIISEEWYLGHGNNKPKGKEETLPYWIGSVVKSLCKKSLTQDLEFQLPSI